MLDKKDIHKGHRQRMRERAAEEGLFSFPPHEVLEILLYYAIPRQDVSELAHRLIDRFGTVGKVLSAQKEEILSVEGIGAQTAEWLIRVGALVNAYAQLRADDFPRVCSLSDAFAFAESRSVTIERPSVWCLYLSPGGIVRCFSRLCSGEMWLEPQTQKKCLMEISSLHARNAIVIVYSQDEPILPDSATVADTAYMLKAINAELTDVLLIGKNRNISLRQLGMLTSK